MARSVFKGMLSVAAFTGGRNVPSARFRVRQYIGELMRYGISMKEMPAALSVYPPTLRALRMPWACATLAQRIPSILRSHSYDVVLLQREMLSTYATLESITGKPRVLDVDDAIYLLGPRRFAERLAQISELVICGNSFLADFFSKWSKRVTVIPTGVDTQRYIPRNPAAISTSRLIIGWIGTSANLPHLLGVESALGQVLNLVPSARIRVISDRKPKFRKLNDHQVTFVQWSMEREVAEIQAMDIGIMPLDDSPWAKGKCAFKMLQYMACGVPTVVSPVGANLTVLQLGLCGISAKSEGDWVDGLVQLLRSDEIRRQMGKTARRIVERHFSIKALAPRIAEQLLRISSAS